jgi:hypothetical protein
MLAGCPTGGQHGAWLPVSSDHQDEEELLVATVRAFPDRDVKPTVREVEHANTYPRRGPAWAGTDGVARSA